MANGRGDKEHLGVDTNVLVAYLDRDHPNHPQTEGLRNHAIAVSPTIIHEAYHSLVFKMRWDSNEARVALEELLADRNNLFLNQTLQTTKVGLDIAVKYGLGGRDALILANLLGANIGSMVSLDQDLIRRGSVSHRKNTLKIRSL